MSRMTTILDAEAMKLIIDGYRRLMGTGHLDKPRLGDVLEDVADHPGSMTRAQLAYGVMANGSRPPHEAVAFAVAVEYFHTASLLLDDLPCMDNAMERRGHQCPHVRYGEDAAILAALALINKSYALIWPLLAGMPARRATAVSAEIDHCLGSSGLIGGQARDLAFSQSKRTSKEIIEIAEGKTGTLFRLCLVVPAMISGCSKLQIRLLEQLSRCWGRAYQLADDFIDVAASSAEGGKTTARDALLSRPNLVNAMGQVAAGEALKALLQEAASIMNRLAKTSGRWGFLNAVNRKLSVLPETTTAAVSAA